MTKSIPPKSLVLYADDDHDDHILVKDAFEEFSSQVQLVHFNDGTELLSYVEALSPFEPKPCLIILDVNMPMLDGKQTLQKIRGLDDFKSVPVVLFTTSTLPSEIAFAKAYDAGFITKPLHAEQIHVIVDQFIAHCTDDVRERIKRSRRK